MSAQAIPVALPLRSHTIFGVCEAIGEDFSFNPVLLRVPLAAMVVVNPLWAIGAYFVLGLVVLASRFLYPDPKPVEAEAPQRLVLPPWGTMATPASERSATTRATSPVVAGFTTAAARPW